MLFYIVRFNSGVISEKRAVVPSIWLNKDDTFCILPPDVTTGADIEQRAQLQVQPSDGWHMHSVKSLKIFSTYAQAKQELEMMKKKTAVTTRPSTSKGAGRIQKRSRRPPPHFDEYVVSIAEKEQDESDEEFAVSEETADSDSDLSATERGPEEIAVVNPQIVKVEPLSPTSFQTDDVATRLAGSTSTSNRATTGAPASKRPRVETLSTGRSADGNVPLDNAALRMVFQSMKQLQKAVDANTRHLQQIAAQQQSATRVTNEACLPDDFPVTLPMTQDKDIEELDAYLRDDSRFTQTTKKKDLKARSTMQNSCLSEMPAVDVRTEKRKANSESENEADKSEEGYRSKEDWDLMVKKCEELEEENKKLKSENEDYDLMIKKCEKLEEENKKLKSGK